MLPLFFAQLRPSVAPPPWMRCGPAARVLASGRQVLGDHVQIMGNDAQSDPALHAGGPSITTAVQPVAPFQSADPPFDPARQLRPARNHSCRSYASRFADFLPGLGSTTSVTPCCCGIALIGGGMQPTIPRQQGGRMAKLLAGDGPDSAAVALFRRDCRPGRHSG